jgi:glutaredoxin
MFMKGFILLTSLGILALSAQASAEIYKWVDEHGRTHFSDKAPASAQVEEVTIKINTYSSPSYSPDIFTSDDNEKPGKRSSSKVTMYSTTWCGVCKKAKAYFRQNRISYTEYDVENSARGKQDFQKMNGKGVPIILVGNKRLNGFSQASFEQLYGK